MEWTIDTTPTYVEKYGEDGPYTATGYIISSTSDNGLVYTYTGFSSFDLEETERKVASMNRRKTDDWSPRGNKYWHFDRYVYGSDAYCNNYREAEMSAMDDEEIYHKRMNMVI